MLLHSIIALFILLDDSGDINYHVCSILPTNSAILESPVLSDVKNVSTTPDTA